KSGEGQGDDTGRQSSSRHDLTSFHLAANQREAKASSGQREATSHAAHVLFAGNDPVIDHGLTSSPEQSAQVSIGMTAEMESRHGLLPGVAPLVVRHTVVLVEAHLLDQCPV